MSDAALVWLDSEADLALDGADLLLESGLETAVIVSFFCDRRADVTDVLPDVEGGRRGWWGDLFSDAENDRTGSRLWLLSREKRTQETLERARQYALEALAWMIEDEIAASVAVATSFVSLADLGGSGLNPHEFALLLDVTISKPDGTRESFRYAYQWTQQLMKRV